MKQHPITGWQRGQSSLLPEAKLCKWRLEGRIPAQARGFQVSLLQALLGSEHVMEKAALVCVPHLAYLAWTAAARWQGGFKGDVLPPVKVHFFASVSHLSSTCA